MTTRPLVFVAVMAAAAAANAANDPVLNTPEAKLSYAIGLDVARSISQLGVDMDAELVARGITDRLAGKPALMTDKEMRNTLEAFFKKMRDKREQAEKAKSAGAIEQGKAFLAANGKKDGVKTTASGLQYKVVRKGNGVRPKADDTVSVHYTGRLIDGTVFDSSYKRGQPAKFPVNRVIPGWTEALQLMDVGSKYQLYIPSALAYGPRGAGPKIGPNSTLIFDVELLSIEPK